MKTKSMMTAIVLASLVAPFALLSADSTTNGTTGSNTTADTIEHPVQAYQQHEATTDANSATESAQAKKEAKARMDQAKADYEKSLAQNGANSDVTKEAKSRLSDAKKEYRKYAKKQADADKDLMNDTQKSNQNTPQ